jgi:hypothetical protein
MSVCRGHHVPVILLRRRLFFGLCDACANPGTLSSPIAADFGVADNDDLILPPFDTKYPISRLTVEMWIRPRSIFQDRIQTVMCSRKYEENSFMLLMFQSELAVHISGNNPKTLRFAGSKLPTNAWTHVAITYDAPFGLLELYLNASLVTLPCEPGLLGGNTTIDGTVLSSEVLQQAKKCKFVKPEDAIAMGAVSIGDCSNGQLDAHVKELRLWSEVRNDRVIRANYDCALDPVGNPYKLTGVPAVDAMHSMTVGGLLAIYPLAGDTNDVSGHHRNASGQVRWSEDASLVISASQPTHAPRPASPAEETAPAVAAEVPNYVNYMVNFEIM